MTPLTPHNLGIQSIKDDSEKSEGIRLPKRENWSRENRDDLSEESNNLSDSDHDRLSEPKGNERSSEERNKKRTRRPAIEIERKFVCWCGKAYGSEGSLN
jgi:hypothetical protein